MDVREKLDMLGAAARFDDCRTSAPDAVAEGRGFFAPETNAAPDPRVLPCISHLHTPGGQRKATLKILQTSVCQNNCNYCAFRAGRDVRRAHLTPDELARSFDLMYRAGLVESLFLSSGVSRHAPDDGRDAGHGRVGAAEVRVSGLHPSQAAARRRGRTHRAGGRAGRSCVDQPGGADPRDAGRARAAQADGCAGGAAAESGGDHR